MTVNIKTTDGHDHNFDNAIAAHYSEITDLFTVYAKEGVSVRTRSALLRLQPALEVKMGDIAELETYP